MKVLRRFVAWLFGRGPQPYRPDGPLLRSRYYGLRELRPDELAPPSRPAGPAGYWSDRRSRQRGHAPRSWRWRGGA